MDLYKYACNYVLGNLDTNQLIDAAMALLEVRVSKGENN